MRRVIKDLNLKEGNCYLFFLRTGATIKARVLDLIEDVLIIETEDAVEEVRKENIYFYSKVC